MRFQMEELASIVGELAGKYTGLASTSITYEKAEQLIEAVLYCIREWERTEEKQTLLTDKISAKQAYELGLNCVEEKVRKALELYNETLRKFSCYENRCLYDTFVKGMPEFFRWYDIRFAPQDAILTLDYPILRDLSGYDGIDRIYGYLTCISLEQTFLQAFPEEYVIRALSGCHPQYRDMIENLCEMVFADVIRHVLAGKPLSEEIVEEDAACLDRLLAKGESGELSDRLKNVTRELVQRYCGGSKELEEYLTDAVSGILVRLEKK